MHANFTMPLAWATGDLDAETSNRLPLLDPHDKTLIDIILAIRDFTEREKKLALLMIRTIAAWSVLPEA